jgi:nucleoside-diphosphate-sugar epimerase
VLIVVTGSSGRLGAAVVRELIGHGHDVAPLDIRASDDSELPATRVTDLNRYDDVAVAMRGAEAVCHLGNYPGFGEDRAAAGFANNTNSTFNVFQAAGALGIRRIVNASSIQAYGMVRNHAVEVLVPPEYLPVDEEHPLLACNPYGLSKAVGESIAEAQARRRPGTCVFSLRFTYIARGGATGSGPLTAALGTYVHQADAARGVRLCCESDRAGYTALNIVARWPARPWSAEEVIGAYGRMPPLKREIESSEPLLCYRKAQEVIGFTARFKNDEKQESGG